MSGAFIGTIMAFNVFAVIIPNQRKLVAQLVRGEVPEARYGLIGKQRSLHNNYLTLPVLAIMVSPHYPFLSDASSGLADRDAHPCQRRAVPSRPQPRRRRR